MVWKKGPLVPGCCLGASGAHRCLDLHLRDTTQPSRPPETAEASAWRKSGARPIGLDCTPYHSDGFENEGMRCWSHVKVLPSVFVSCSLGLRGFCLGVNQGPGVRRTRFHPLHAPQPLPASRISPAWAGCSCPAFAANLPPQSCTEQYALLMNTTYASHSHSQKRHQVMVATSSTHARAPTHCRGRASQWLHEAALPANPLRPVCV